MSGWMSKLGDRSKGPKSPNNEWGWANHWEIAFEGLFSAQRTPDRVYPRKQDFSVSPKVLVLREPRFSDTEARFTPTRNGERCLSPNYTISTSTIPPPLSLCTDIS